MLFLTLLPVLVSAYISLPMQAIPSPHNLKSSSLYNSNQVFYAASIWVGTPSQYFSVVVDTGSSVIVIQYFWVESYLCTPCAHFTNQFVASQSSTFSMSSKEIKLEYGGGNSAVGLLSKDIVGIGDNSTRISVESYFVLVTSDYMFGGYPKFEGILGLGFSGLSDGYPTLLSSLKKAGIIQNAVFAMYLNHLGYPGRTPGGYGNPASNLEIGGYDLQKYSYNGEIAVNISISTDPGYWKAKIPKIQFGDKGFKSRSAIFDSGTTLILAPTDDYEKIMSYLIETYSCVYTGVIVCDCELKLPMFTLVFNEVELDVPLQMLWEPSDGLCTLLIDESDMWILGQVFLQNYYAIYDMDQKKLRLAAVYANTTIQNKYDSSAIALSAYFVSLILLVT